MRALPSWIILEERPWLLCDVIMENGELSGILSNVNVTESESLACSL